MRLRKGWCGKAAGETAKPGGRVFHLMLGANSHFAEGKCWRCGYDDSWAHDGGCVLMHGAVRSSWCTADGNRDTTVLAGALRSTIDLHYATKPARFQAYTDQRRPPGGDR